MNRLTSVRKRPLTYRDLLNKAFRGETLRRWVFRCDDCNVTYESASWHRAISFANLHAVSRPHQSR